MDMREINAFVVLAQQLHFGRAASLLHLSQPALTKQIRRLEADLGCELFKRGKSGTKLTITGEMFLREARVTLNSFESLQETGRRLSTGEGGRLRLGFGFHTTELVPKLIGRLRQAAPSVEFSLRDMSTAEQTKGLRDDTIDIGFVRLPMPKEFESMPVITDRLALITSAESALPSNATLSDCRREPFVLISNDRAPTFHQHVVSLCSLHGFHPRIIQETNEVTTSLALVRANLGVSLIPQSFWSTPLTGVRLHELNEPEASWSVGAAWRNDDANPVLERFLSLLRAEIGGNPEREP